jgi:transposase
MARATWLTEVEKVQTSTLKKRGDSNRQIAKAINRSEKQVRNFLKLGQKYGTKSKRRNCVKVRAQQIGRIRHEASRNHRSAAQIVDHLNLLIKKRRVQQIW